MSQICHAHCPPGGGHAIGATVTAIGAAAGSAAAALIGDILLAAGIAVIVLVIAGTWLLLHLLHRDRKFLASQEDIAALITPQPAALPAPRQPVAGAYVITDARARQVTGATPDISRPSRP